jgi:predicted dehydrogenase/threonine dehydrogenase-like Zn-dependent dehydrogenase
MKQLLQDLRSGELMLLEVPDPQPGPGQVLIRTRRSLISAGTERMLTNFARAGYLEKARLQPERLKQVVEKIRTDGLLATIESVRARLEQPMALGYCNAGEVVAVGAGVSGLSAGDRVVSNSPHAELVLAPGNLCARVPAGVDDDQAAFAVVTAIGLQAVRLISPGIGESVVVAGLGLIGLLSVQILRAAGCRVIGFDPGEDRVDLARELGADAFVAGEDDAAVATVAAMTAGAGADAILITASASDDDLVSQCAQMSRKRGRIVLTGVVGLNLRRADFYEKELTFQVSCSYGPGRYDPDYEERGIDYPRAFVRWTAGRNFAAALDLMAAGRIETDRLVTHREPFATADRAFERLARGGDLGILLEYAGESRNPTSRAASIARPVSRGTPGSAIAVIGAGSFTQGRILPALRRAGADVSVIASAGGTSAAIAARRFGIRHATTETDSILADESIGAVIISTRHDQHARLVLDALQAGKHVFVEKPLCLSETELDAIISARLESMSRAGAAPALVVGFNRRHAPLARRMRDAMLRRTGPAFVVFNCNAGALPAGHWVHDPAVGGGRLVGEACHFIDFAQFLIGSRIGSVQAAKTRLHGPDPEDSFAIALDFEDGSIGQINYHSIGHRAFPKERCEAAFDGKTVVLDNFRRLSGFGATVAGWSLRQDKGHDAQFRAFWGLVSGAGAPAGFPVPFDTVVDVMRATFRASRALRGG